MAKRKSVLRDSCIVRLLCVSESFCPLPLPLPAHHRALVAAEAAPTRPTSPPPHTARSALHPSLHTL